MIDNKVAKLKAIKQFLFDISETFKGYCTDQIEVARDEDDKSESNDDLSDYEDDSGIEIE